jgi:hypothetical protein
MQVPAMIKKLSAKETISGFENVTVPDIAAGN